MRKIVVEFEVPDEYEADYADVCTELVAEDLLGLPVRVISDSAPPVKDNRDG